LNSIGRGLPAGAHPLKEMAEPVTPDNWICLIETYCLDCLKLDPAPEACKKLNDTRAGLRTLGLHLGESGLRKYVSPQQRVIALSENKVQAVVQILHAESQTMQDGLRAVVITDFEKANSLSTKSLESVLDPESGGAALVLRTIIGDAKTDQLDAIMVTGQSVLLDMDLAAKFQDAANLWFRENELTAKISIRNTEYKKVGEILGEGRDWRPRNYVRLVTALFEKGITRCIVGTRGLLGEGWDSLSLNTLIDLTSATTFATVNQVRGRSIRLDPSYPRKLSNNWDIVCVGPQVVDGNCDLLRLVRKHEQYYGISQDGEIVKGIDHLDSKLYSIDRNYLELAAPVLAGINERSFSRAENRGKAYDLWKICQGQEGIHLSAIELNPVKIKFRTAFTYCDSLKRLMGSILLAIAGFAAMSLPRDPATFFRLLNQPQSMPTFVILGSLFLGGAAGLIFSGKLIYKYFRKAFVDLPVDFCLRDIGLALFEALQQGGFISAGLTSSSMVIKESYGVYRVYLQNASECDGETFGRSYHELMSPILDQRYLVSRDESSLRGDLLSPLFHLARIITRAVKHEEIAYHPVPELFGRTRELADVFGYAWARHVGGGRLIYTRSEKGKEILLRYGLDRRLDLGVKKADIWI
jgi:hypothetical protein